MGFTWTKEQKTTPKAQIKIGLMANKIRIKTYDECGLTASEIAEKMDMSESSVRAVLEDIKKGRLKVFSEMAAK